MSTAVAHVLNPIPAIVAVLGGPFFAARGLEPAPRPPGAGGSGRRAALLPTPEEAVGEARDTGCVRLDARRAGPPRGERAHFVALVLEEGGGPAQSAGPLKTLLDLVARDFPEGRGLDELILVAPKSFFARSSLVEVVRSYAKKWGPSPPAEPTLAGLDPEGGGAFVSAHPSVIFHTDVLANPCVPRHRVMGAREAADFLAGQRKRPGDFDVILAADPAAVWVGARAGQLVEIDRDSPIVGRALAYRVVCSRPRD